MPAFSTWRASATSPRSSASKLEFVPLKTDTIGLKAAIAGELDSFEGGPGGSIVAAARGADVKIIGCSWLGGTAWRVRARQHFGDGRPSRANRSRSRRPAASPSSWPKPRSSRPAWPFGDVKFASMGSDTDRYKALARRRGRRRHREQRISADRRQERHQGAGGGQQGGAKFRARLPACHRQNAERAARRCGENFWPPRWKACVMR